MTKVMGIYYDDLNEDAQKRYDELFGYDSNLDIYPITVIEQEDNEDF